MKQIINITLLTIVLSIPFALSQTRKAIPSGRYEALSGIRFSHSLKNADSSLTKDSLGLFLFEVAKHIPQGRSENLFYSMGVDDKNLTNFFISKGVQEANKLDDKVSILLSDNLTRDNDLLSKIRMKGNLIILKDKHGLKDVLSSFNQFDLIIYQAESESNYFLLKQR